MLAAVCLPTFSCVSGTFFFLQFLMQIERCKKNHFRVLNFDVIVSDCWFFFSSFPLSLWLTLSGELFRVPLFCLHQTDFQIQLFCMHRIFTIRKQSWLQIICVGALLFLLFFVCVALTLLLLNRNVCAYSFLLRER